MESRAAAARMSCKSGVAAPLAFLALFSSFFIIFRALAQRPSIAIVFGELRFSVGESDAATTSDRRIGYYRVAVTGGVPA